MIEAALVLVACVVPLPVPAVVPLVVVASLSLWLRGRSWAEVSKARRCLPRSARQPVLALVLAILFGTPAIETITDYAVQWSMQPVVRGNVATFAIVAVVVAASAAASELLRGWIVERALELRWASSRRGIHRCARRSAARRRRRDPHRRRAVRARPRLDVHRRPAQRRCADPRAARVFARRARTRSDARRRLTR